MALVSKMKKRNRKTYQANERTRTHVFALMEQRAALVRQAKLMRTEEGASYGNLL